MVRVVTWAGVSLLVAGLSILAYKYVERLGDLTILVLLALATPACYGAAWHLRRATSKNVILDYLPLLGGLLLSVAISFAESRYHMLDDRWRWHLLILFALHASAAYLLDSRRLLSLAVLSLLGYLSVDPDGAFWGEATESGFDLLRGGAAVLVWRIAHEVSLAAWPHFRRTLETFVFHFLLLGGLLLTLDSHVELIGLAVVLCSAALAIWWGLRKGIGNFVVFAVLYAATAVEISISRRIDGDVERILFLIACNLPLLILLYRIRRKWSTR